MRRGGLARGVRIGEEQNRTAPPLVLERMDEQSNFES